MKYQLHQVDFSVPAVHGDQCEIFETLKKLGLQNGYLIDSGNSYHYQGRDLLGHKDWTGFMKSLKSHASVDPYWPDQMLFLEYSVLRLTAKDKTSKTKEPEVIAEIGKMRKPCRSQPSLDFDPPDLLL